MSSSGGGGRAAGGANNGRMLAAAAASSSPPPHQQQQLQLQQQQPASVNSDRGYSSDDDATDELIERILENYTFRFEPELRFKLKHTTSEVALAACYARPWSQSPRYRFTAKPVREGTLVSRYVRSALLVPELGQVALFSQKIPLGVLRLQFVLGFNWRRGAPSLDYRLTTKWGDGPRSLRRKERAKLSDAMTLRAKWSLDAHFPDLEGHIGGGGGGGGNNNNGGGGGAGGVDVDYGGASFEIVQLDAVLEV